MIEISHITKSFGKIRALDDFSLNVDAGSIIGVVGSNGGGKSTLLRLLSGVYDPDGGQITLDGKKAGNNPSVKNICAFVPDFPYFSNSATLQKEAAFYKRLYTGWNDEKYNLYHSMLPIDDKMKIINMSKGLQRQAALILALSTCPRYIFFDEIFDGLDPVARRTAKGIIIDCVSENNASVVIASHNLRELEELCDRVCLVHEGKMILEREIDEIKLGVHKVQAAFDDLDESGFSERLVLSGLDGSVVRFWKNGSIFNIIVKGEEADFMPMLKGFAPSYISCVPMTLEEIFVSEMEAIGYDSKNVL